MKGEAGPARFNRLGVLAVASVFFGKLGERNRRRIPLDPASQVFKTRLIDHPLPHCNRL